MPSTLASPELRQKDARRSLERSQRGILANESGLSDTEQLMLRLARMTESKRLTEMLNHHLSSGGKRLRARLALASVEALGGFRQDAIAWAAAVELLHNASLVHDDIQDGDRMRRGRPTLWVQHGSAQAINAGDMLISYMVRIVERLSLSSALVNEPELHRVALELAERAMRPIQHVIETKPQVRRYLSSIFERQLTEIIHR